MWQVSGPRRRVAGASHTDPSIKIEKVIDSVRKCGSRCAASSNPTPDLSLPTRSTTKYTFFDPTAVRLTRCARARPHSRWSFCLHSLPDRSSQEVDDARRRAEALSRRAHEASAQQARKAAARATQREVALARRADAAERRAKVSLPPLFFFYLRGLGFYSYEEVQSPVRGLFC